MLEKRWDDDLIALLMGMGMRLLSEEEVQSRLQKAEYWEHDGNAIKREWNFQNFSEAMDFINMVAVICESHNHHPEIFNAYNRVSLRFYTYDVDGLSDIDFELAMEINKL